MSKKFGIAIVGMFALIGGALTLAYNSYPSLNSSKVFFVLVPATYLVEPGFSPVHDVNEATSQGDPVLNALIYAVFCLFVVGALWAFRKTSE